MIVSTGLTVPVAVTVREIVPRATGTVVYCIVFLVLRLHEPTATAAMPRIETAATANLYFLRPGHAFLPMIGVFGNFMTLLGASTFGVSKLALMPISRVPLA